jgi:iron-sulfur cluster repair protein YtfE (RIC family)
MESIMTTTSIERDEAAANAIRRHHEHLMGELEQLVADMANAVEQSSGFERPKANIVTWARAVLAPHAAGEERTLYRAAAGTEAGRLLITGMVAEHGVILGIVDELEASTEPAVAAAWAEALHRVFTSHAAKENDLVLPLLVSEPEINVAELLEDLHEEAH